jgi:hypothetical protein
MIGVVASASPELSGALGIAGDDLDLAALDAAAGVDGIHCEDHAAIESDSGRRARAGHGGKEADLDRLRLGESGLWK